MKYIENKLNANIVKLKDANNNYTSENVEGALEEIDSKIKNIEDNGYDDTQIKQDINNIKTEIGTEELTTTDQTIKGAVNEIDSRIKDVANEIESGKVGGNLINQNGGSALKIWAGTKAEFELLQEKDSNTVYIVEGLNTETSKTYTVTNNLSNCSSNNSSTSVDENSSYSATIIADTGYTLDSVNITMGGTDITNSCYSNGVITIENVIGDIIITITSTQDSSGEISDIFELNTTMPNNLLTGNTSVGYINTSGDVVNTSGNTVWDNYFDVNALKKYAFISDATNYYLADYDSDKVFISRIKNEIGYIPSSNSKFMRCAIQSTDTSSTGLYLIPDSNIIKMEHGGIAASTGNPIETTKEIRSSKFIYGIHGMANINIKTNKYFKIRFYDISQNFISTTYANALQGNQVTVPENAYSMKLIIDKNSTASEEITSEDVNTTIISINNIPYSFIMEA